MDGRPTGARAALARARTRWPLTRARVRRAAPFASGVVAALVAVCLYGALNPPPAPLSTKDVQTTVDQTLASQTPPPADALLVYRAAQPSLVLIEAIIPNAPPDQEGLGSGVVVDDQGDVLTALHVVDTATSIKLTFADGTVATGLVQTRQPDHDIAVVHAVAAKPNVPPATLGNPNSV